MEEVREDTVEFDCGFMKLLGCEELLFHSPCDDNLVSLPRTSCNYSKMLNFGGENDDMVLINELCGDGLLYSTVNRDATRRGKYKPKKKLNNNDGELRSSDQVAAGSLSLSTTVTTTPKKHKQRTSKNVKVRKEKLGERIGTLQQLVSPYGKSDTATVLHEVVGYITFLHDQLQVLSFAYFQQNEEKGNVEDLRSKGLCLVPTSYIRNVDKNGNGADIWLPATNSAMKGSSSSS